MSTRSDRRDALIWLARIGRPHVLLLVLIPLGWIFSVIGAPANEAYWLDRTAATTRSVLVVAPIVAAWLAYFGARERMSQAAYLGRPITRSRLAVAGAYMLPILLASIAAQGVILALRSTGMIGAPGSPAYAVLGLMTLVVAAHGAVGYFLGRVLPRTIAVPLSATLSYLWLAMPRAVEPFWIRNINGELGSRCCDLDQTLGPGGLVGPVLFNAGLLAASLLVIVAASWRRVAPIALLVAVGGLVAGRSATLELGPDPVAYRTEGLTCQRVDSLDLCWWPEHNDASAAALRAVPPAVRRLGDAGFPIPESITEAGGQANTWGISFAQHPGGLELALASAPVASTLTGCSSLSADQAMTAETLTALGRLALDIETDGFENEAVVRASEVLRDPAPTRIRVVRAGLAQLRMCRR